MTEERNRQPEEPKGPKPIQVQLTPEEVEYAEAVAAQRYEIGVKLRERYATPEEDTCERLMKDNWEELTEPARTMIEEARAAAYAEHLAHNYCFQPEEYEEAAENLYHAALEITERDCEILAKVWRVALAAAASIDPLDETPAGHKINRGDVHYHYRMFARMIEEALQEKNHPSLRNSRAERARREREAWEERVGQHRQGTRRAGGAGSRNPSLLRMIPSKDDG
jgi:hypothetical protein